MATDLGLTYVVVVTLLFVPWAYGLYALVRDGKNRFIPAVRQYREGRKQQKADREAEREREEKEQQLY